MTKRVAIVGYGASAMYAVLACNDKGIIPTVYARTLTIPKGAFWLYSLPVEVGRKFINHKIRIASIGKREVYISKQWNIEDLPKTYKSSFPEKEEIRTNGYDPSTVIPYILSDSKRCRVERINRNFGDQDLQLLSKPYDFVFHSFPSSKLRSMFSEYIEKRKVITIPSKDAITSGYINSLENTVLYDGTYGNIFVRKSFLFDTVYLELGNYECKPLVEHILDSIPNSSLSFFPDIKPNSVPNYPYHVQGRHGVIIPIGRGATFNRSELSHDTYAKVINYLSLKGEEDVS